MPKMKSNFRGLVTLLAKNLYPEPDVFVRELIQNAHDGIMLRRAQEPAHPGSIRLATDAAAGTLEFADDGLGMDRYVIEEFLSTIGNSGTGSFAQALREAGTLDPETIGQFGIGLLSAFVVASRIDVFTRRLGDSGGWHWSNSGDDDYSLEPCDEAPAAGTVVVLSLRPEYCDYLDGNRLASVIRKYADFIPLPIMLAERGPINVIQPPWETAAALPAAAQERFYAEFLHRRYRDRSLLSIPVDLPAFGARGLLYITDQHIPGINTSGFVDLFQGRMSIRARDAEILPEWARFVRGLVDARALQPTAARDNVHRNETYFALRSALGHQVTASLIQTARSRPDYFRQLCAWHRYHFKGLAVVHDEFFREVGRLLPFATSAGDLSIEEYRTRSATPVGQATPLYYFTHRDDGPRFAEVCRARGVIAIDTSGSFDEELLQKLALAFPAEFSLRCLDRLDSRALYAPLPAEQEEAFAPFLGALRTAIAPLSRHPVDPLLRRFDPQDLPALLLETTDTSAAEGLRTFLSHPQLPDDWATLAAALDHSIEKRPRQLLLNVANPTVQALALAPPRADAAMTVCLRALYIGALTSSRERFEDSTEAALRSHLREATAVMLELRVQRERLGRDPAPAPGRLATPPAPPSAPQE